MKTILKNFRLFALIASILLTSSNLICMENNQVSRPEVTTKQTDALKSNLFLAIATSDDKLVEEILTKMIKLRILDDNLCDLILCEATKMHPDGPTSISATISKVKFITPIAKLITSLGLIASGAAIENINIITKIGIFLVGVCFYLDSLKDLRSAIYSKKVLDIIQRKIKQKRAFEAKKTKELQTQNT